MPTSIEPLRHPPPGGRVADEALWRDYVRGRLGSTTAALALVLAIAISAIGVATWALLSSAAAREEASDREARLEQELRGLRMQADQRSIRTAVASLADQQRALRQSLDAIVGAIDRSTEDTASLRLALDRNRQALDDLARRVDEIDRGAVDWVP